MKFKKNLSIWSKIKKNIAATIANKTTITAPVNVSLPVGQVTLKASCLTPCINLNGLIIIITFLIWQERRGSNPQPPVLETGALPIELHS